MRKFRVIFIALILLLVFTAVANARQVRIGIEAGNPSLVLIIRPAPFDLKFGYDFTGLATGGGGNFIHLSADIRLIDSYRLIDFLHFFMSVGAYVQIATGQEFDVGARVPVGVQAFLLDGNIEIFAEIVPTFGFLPAPSVFQVWQGWIGVTLPLPKLK